MKHDILFACIVSLFLAVGYPGDAQTQNNQGLTRINPERAKAAKKAADDGISAYGDGREFSQSDVRLVNTYAIASRAERMNHIAQSRTLQLTKRMNLERIHEVVEASDRVVVAFNDNGADASFKPHDLELLQVFLTAVVAADTLEKATSPAATKDLKRAEIAKAIEASKRVLAAFNERGGSADITSADDEILRAFVKTVPGEPQ